jgi:peptidoglycan/LPS O-acetylase OafA/YrhL
MKKLDNLKTSTSQILEIDSLRGLSALLIILSHISFLQFASGGINIFFVISGYLIAHISLKNLSSFDLLFFLINRFLSIYPLIFITSSLTFFLLIIFGDLDKNFIQISRSYISSILLILNFYFIKIQHLYALQNYLNPYLIFWSLSVIFQFYLIYGILLKIIFIIFIKLKKKISYLVLLKIFSFVLLIFFLLPLALNDLKILNDFYSPFSRLWQFFLGIVCYLITKKENDKYHSSIKYINFIPLSFIILILWQVYSKELGYYLASILTSLSTFFIIFSLKANKFSNFILKLKFLVSLGKISFPLILVHLPILYFLEIYLSNKIFILIFTLLLSYLTSIMIYKIKFNFIYEEFFNHKKIIFSTLAILIFINLFLSILYFKKKEYFTNKEYNLIKYIKSNINYFDKLKENLFKNEKNKLNSRSIYGNNGEECFNNSDPIKNCKFNINGTKPDIFFIGGSNGANIASNLKDFFIGRNHPFHLFASNTCLYVQNFNKVDILNGETDANCNEERLSSIKKEIFKKKNSIIILTSRYQLIYNESYFDDGEGNIEGKFWRYRFVSGDKNTIKKNLLNAMLKDILEISKNNKVILIYPFPEFAVNTIRIKTIKPEAVISSSYKSYINRSKEIIEMFDSIKNANVYRVYPDKIFCNTFISERCVAATKDSIYFEDASHLTLAGINLINQEIFKIYKTIIIDKLNN